MQEPVNPPKKKRQSNGPTKRKPGWKVPSLEDLEKISDKFTKPKDVNGNLTYTDELADEICHAIATHPYGLERICKKFPHFPDKCTIWAWRLKYSDFSDKYYKAKLLQADLHVEECVDISDDTSIDKKMNHNGDEVTNNEAVNRSRLKVDTRKWIASKLLPKQYGDKQLVEDLQAENERLRRDMIEYRRTQDEKNKKDY